MTHRRIVLGATLTPSSRANSQIPVTKFKAQVPPHAGNDKIVSKPAAAKERMTQ